MPGASVAAARPVAVTTVPVRPLPLRSTTRLASVSARYQAESPDRDDGGGGAWAEARGAEEERRARERAAAVAGDVRSQPGRAAAAAPKGARKSTRKAAQSARSHRACGGGGEARRSEPGGAPLTAAGQTRPGAYKWRVCRQRRAAAARAGRAERR